MKKQLLLLLFLFFGLVVFAGSVRAQSNIVSALAEGYTPEEMESLYKALTPSNHKTYLKNKGYKFDQVEDDVFYYKKNDVVSLIVAFADSRVAALGFESSPQKYYQAESLLEKNYKQIDDVEADGVTYQQWKKGEFIFRADKENYSILIIKESDL